MSESQAFRKLHTIVFRSGRVVRVEATELRTSPQEQQTFVICDGVLVATLAAAEVAAIFHASVELP